VDKNEKKREETNSTRLTGLVEKDIRALVNRQIKEEKEKPIEEKMDRLKPLADLGLNRLIHPSHGYN
jgi:hypothetical protein